MKEMTETQNKFKGIFIGQFSLLFSQYNQKVLTTFEGFVPKLLTMIDCCPRSPFLHGNCAQ